jgi:hypothetical protein
MQIPIRNITYTLKTGKANYEQEFLERHPLDFDWRQRSLLGRSVLLGRAEA